ncbi:hypothetical protein NCAS_0H01280 [Naumovozyma castellii]|uniref:RNA helicase n=1 Tax=Naumovozyma castellii TaxID=27288 RepID=G0VIW1_NAUCA|nr:hypothetical protein NCAS_0H01280 [Naumovozyma castellii CBS 4309]CCC71438.1 hypothetical protein NCAS_0H01280 [Naumovozyma castellii CBS 4309]
MIPINSEDSSHDEPPNGGKITEKQRLLQERREKLAKWKQKKTQQDLEKKKPVTNVETNLPLAAKDKFAERTSKLEEWKRKKRERDAERKLQDQKSVASTEEKQQNIVSKKRKKKKQTILFGDDVDESKEEASSNIQTTNESLTEIYKPSSIDLAPVRHHSNIDSKKPDPLDEFMNSLGNSSANSTSFEGRTIAGDLLDAEDESLMTGISHEKPSTDDGVENSRYTKLAKLKAKKKVTEVLYDKSTLEPFQKNFYAEPEDIKQMSDSEIEELRLSLDNIKVKGTNCPLPITRWSQLGLNTDTMNLITKNLRYETLTPIQSQAIPAIMSGRDVIGISKTGSGKTISYLLPLLRHIKAQRPLSKNETGPLGLILAPTRELALQIHDEIERFIVHDENIRSICCTGGSELKKQINDLKRGVQIVVATPGRFIDLLTLNTGKLVSTERITFVIMDEADRLFDLGFEPQITQIMKTIRPDKQCVLFSATFPNKLRNFAMRILNSPLSITINSNNLVNENVEQKVAICETDSAKFQELLTILQNQNKQQDQCENDEDEEREDETTLDKKTIIFVASQQICDLLYSQLVNFGYSLFAIHAGKPYQERITNLEGFKNTKNSILICTEVLSRGLNVPEVSLVIIYNAVKTFAQYVHTTGRTARGNLHGIAITLLLPSELTAGYILFKAMRANEKEKHDPFIIETLQGMAEEFEKGMKVGKYRLSKGFGGKGLDNLENKREEKQTEERRKYSPANTGTSDASKGKTNLEEGGEVTQDTNSIEIPKLEYAILQNKNPDGSITFSADVNVNDLPQLVRWEATKNTTLMFIKHETGCSITNKGKYYPEGKSPSTDKDEPKLYLLIESKDEKDIRLSIELLEEKVREGIRKVEYQTLKSNKY